MASNPPIKHDPRPDPRDDAFIREVDERVREDELKRLFQTYGRWALLAVIVALAALGGWLFWQHRQEQARDAASETFLTALDKVDAGGSTEALAAIQPLRDGDGPGYRALAMLTEAGVAARGGDVPKAAGLYNAVAGEADLPLPLRDLARIKAVRLEFDRLPPAQVITRLQPYLQPGNPWFGVAGELAGIAHLRANRPDLAGPLFMQVARDETASPSVRARAEQLAASLGQDTGALAERPAANVQGAPK